jgi:predicted small secreted protein
MKIIGLNIARLAFGLVVLGGMSLSLAACNTTEGAGKDIKATGNAIQKSAEENKPQ